MLVRATVETNIQGIPFIWKKHTGIVHAIKTVKGSEGYNT